MLPMLPPHLPIRSDKNQKWGGHDKPTYNQKQHKHLTIKASTLVLPITQINKNEFYFSFRLLFK